MRFTSLDELPQLWNVIRGDMSLIGPRPLPVHYLHLFYPEQKTRHDLRPGITGLAQVKGRHNISWEDKFAFDLYYVKHISLMLDLKIFFRTLWLLVSPKQDTSLDEKPFTGASSQK
jgi:undecaprenyl phosphate N,N'-diacetylbacillosamine 1-phosphate transferase/sugar transferase EpsL